MIATFLDRCLFLFFYAILRNSLKHPNPRSLSKESILGIKRDPERRRQVRMQVLSYRLWNWKLRHWSARERGKFLGNDTCALASILDDNPFLYRFVLREFKKKPIRGSWCAWLVRNLLFEFYSKLKVRFEPEDPAYAVFGNAAAAFRSGNEDQPREATGMR